MIRLFIIQALFDLTDAEAIESDLTPMRKVGEAFSRHLDNIQTFCQHQIITGAAEGLNSKIMAIKRRMCGCRNREHDKNAVYFVCGGLDLYQRHAELRDPRKTLKDQTFCRIESTSE